MKNVLIYNLVKPAKLPLFDAYARTQIINSFDLGWNRDNILLFTNFPYAYEGVEAHVINLDTAFCITGTKVLGLKTLFEKDLINDNIWIHDFDVWQQVPFDFPEIREVGVVERAGPGSPYSGGSIFYRPSAKDIVCKIADTITERRAGREENIINEILMSEAYKDRVTLLNPTFNLGYTRFEDRYPHCEQPIKVLSFHAESNRAWKRFFLGGNRFGIKPVDERLERLLRKNFRRYNSLINPVLGGLMSGAYALRNLLISTREE